MVSARIAPISVRTIDTCTRWSRLLRWVAAIHVPPSYAHREPSLGTLERFRRGEPAAFAEVFAATAPAAHALARSICRNATLAEDALQNAYLDVWRSASDYDLSKGPITTWVMRIVRNRSIDILRRVDVTRSAPRGRRVARHAARRRRPLEDVIAADAARTVHGALQALPAAQRRVVELAFAAGLSHTEIAASLQVPVGTVVGRMRLGLSRLRNELPVATTAARMAQQRLVAA